MRGGVFFSEGCLLLLLYMYITSRPDKAASDRQWLQLEQEVRTPEPEWTLHRPTPESHLPLLLLDRGSFNFGSKSLATNR